MTPPPAAGSQPPPDTPFRPPAAAPGRPRLPRFQRSAHTPHRVNMAEPAQRRPVRRIRQPARIQAGAGQPAPHRTRTQPPRLGQARPPPPGMQLPHHLRRHPQQGAEQVRADPVHLPAPHQRRDIRAVSRTPPASARAARSLSLLAACNPPLTPSIMRAASLGKPYGTLTVTAPAEPGSPRNAGIYMRPRMTVSATDLLGR
jgi:hypothetical protein